MPMQRHDATLNAVSTTIYPLDFRFTLLLLMFLLMMMMMMMMMIRLFGDVTVQMFIVFAQNPFARPRLIFSCIETGKTLLLFGEYLVLETARNNDHGHRMIITFIKKQSSTRSDTEAIALEDIINLRHPFFPTCNAKIKKYGFICSGKTRSAACYLPCASSSIPYQSTILRMFV
jgi:hypothetical protein